MSDYRKLLVYQKAVDLANGTLTEEEHDSLTNDVVEIRKMSLGLRRRLRGA